MQILFKCKPPLGFVLNEMIRMYRLYVLQPILQVSNATSLPTSAVLQFALITTVTTSAHAFAISKSLF